jgi:hypothetical protein
MLAPYTPAKFLLL